MSPISKRLTPLYIAAFLQGIPFWYAIEKLFMLEIGFNTASIGLMVAIMSIVMIAVETPSGILADRWSRTGVLQLGNIALFLSALIGALSYNELVFIISTMFWGVYYALYSGTYDSIIYDTVLEEEGTSDRFETFLGRFRMAEGSAFILGALGGGAIAELIGMRETFYISLPFIIVAFFLLWKFREPQLHKSQIAEPIFKHIRQTFATVLQNPVLLPIIIALVAFGVIDETIFELSQLWFIAVAAPVILYGVFFGAISSSFLIGGYLADKFKQNFKIILLSLTVISSITLLIFVRDYWLILLAQFIMVVSLIVLGIILEKRMHDQLPSRLRAGSASVVGTLSRIVLIPGTLVFTNIANETNIFSATYILLFAAIVASVAMYISLRTKHLPIAQ